MKSNDRLQEIVDIYIPTDLPHRAALIRNLEFLLNSAKNEGAIETYEKINGKLSNE